jgi:RNA polymerase sigma factor (TIGR02999 family)
MVEPQFLGSDLVPFVYNELRKLARVRMSRLRPGQTLQPTDLVHEVYVRLMKKGELRWNSRGHFFGAAAQAMRQVLVEHARNKLALKRGGDRARVDMTVTLVDDTTTRSHAELLALHEALEQLQADHPRRAEIVHLRYFAGLTVEEIAEMMNVTTRTVERDWKFARAWLETRLEADEN